MSNFVFPEELPLFVQSIRPFDLKEVGSPKWVDVHEMIIKLSQQAVLEASEFREEEVREALITHDKLKVLIHEAYCLWLWKTRVLPHLLEINPNPPATFLIYTALFHEGAVVSLLDTTLFHVRGCGALQDSAIDLIDYCALGMSQVIGLVSMGYLEKETKIDVDEAVLSELERQKRDLIYKIGLRCISLLSYLADKAAALPLSATRRMVTKHDIPWLMADVLHFRPWQRRTKAGVQHFLGDQWVTVNESNMAAVVKHEAQSWFCLRQIFFNRNLMASYELTEARRVHLSKCLGILHEAILDQLPPLMELKQFLSQLSIATGPGPTHARHNLLLEEIPIIQDNLIKQAETDGGYLGIAHHQEHIFLSRDKEVILQLAQRLNSAYNTDMLADLEEKSAGPKKGTKVEKRGTENTAPTTNVAGYRCSNCLAEAEKKCGKCKTVYYCSRKCQKEDWPKHKPRCATLATIK